MDSILQRLGDTYKFHKGKLRLPWITEANWAKYFGRMDQFFGKFSDKFSESKEIEVGFVLSIFGWQLREATEKDKEKPCL